MILSLSRYRGFSILPSKMATTTLHSSSSSIPHSSSISSRHSAWSSAKPPGRSAANKRPAALPGLEVTSIGQHSLAANSDTNGRLHEVGGGGAGDGQLSYRPPSRRMEADGRRMAGGDGLPEAGSRKVTPETELPRLIGTKSQVRVEKSEEMLSNSI